MNTIHNIFPIPIFKDNISKNLSEIEIDFIKNLKYVDNTFNSRSENTYVLESPDMKPLAGYIQQKVREYFQYIYQPDEKINIYLTQSWINISAENEHHHPHRHPNSFISGVFYIEADREVDKIHFEKEVDNNIRVFPTQYNPYNAASWNFPVETGDLLIFPSTLCHYVQTVPRSCRREKRISLSFNTFLKGNIGSQAFLSELKL